MTQHSVMPLLNGAGASLERYLSMINQIPALTPDEERELAERLQRDGDTQAAQQLIMSHLRFVAYIARGYLGYGLPLQDIIQEGNVGLMKAVKRFDPSTGYRLSSFAVHWVKSEIHEFVLRNWAMVRIATTKAQRKLFFNLRKATKQRQWFSPDEVKKMAVELEVPEHDVLSMEGRMSGRDVGYDVDHDEDDTYTQSTLHMIDHDSDVAQHIEEDQFTLQQNTELTLAFNQLSERNRDILKARVMSENKATLVELAERYGVSHERIRQLEKQALNQMKSLLQAA